MLLSRQCCVHSRALVSLHEASRAMLMRTVAYHCCVTQLDLLAGIRYRAQCELWGVPSRCLG